MQTSRGVELFAVLLSLSFLSVSISSSPSDFRWMPGKATYKTKQKDFKISGSLTLSASWQNTGRMLSNLAASSGMQEIASPGVPGFNGKLFKATRESSATNQTPLTMTCGWETFTRDQIKIIHDFCFQGSREKLAPHLSEVRKTPIQREFALPLTIAKNLKLPVGFMKIGENQERSWYLDTSGLVELEHSSETVGPVKRSASGVGVYLHSMKKVLKKNYSLTFDSAYPSENTLPDKEPVCWFFKGDDRSALLCLRDIGVVEFHNRHSLLAVFPNLDIDHNALRQQILLTMQSWPSSTAN